MSKHGSGHAGASLPIAQQRAFLAGVLNRLRLPYLLDHLPERPTIAVFATVMGFLSIATMAAAALLTDEPYVFPSLGPTAFLFFFAPLAATSSPRNALGGHLIGAAVGYGCLLIFGLEHQGPSTAVGVSWERVLAASLSLGLTSGLMIFLRCPHPPAGATTLIVSLGVLHELHDVAILMVAVVFLTVQAISINRAAGLNFPIWGARDH